MNEQFDIAEWPLELGKIEDAGKVVYGGRIDEYWTKAGIQNKLKPLFSEMPAHDWLYDSEKGRKHFNLRSIEFGNWMNQQDRADFLYASMLSLHHLAQVLGIEDEQIGLSGKLSLALGARGKGRAAGHYEPSPYAVINLTKTKGVGVLAHEYAHAFDNILSFYSGGKRQLYVSGGRTTRKGYDEDIAKEGNYFEKQFEEFFNILYYDRKGENTSFHEALLQAEDYWNRRNEVLARTFEVFISERLKEHGIKNLFLVGSVGHEVYPPAELVKQAEKHLNNILKKGFAAMRKEPKGLEGVAIGVSGCKGFRRTIKERASLDDTLENMKRIAYRDVQQVTELAEKLKGKNVKETAENIWHYLRKNTRYKLDTEGIEELRTPVRSLVDGKMGLEDKRYGIDCDDYTILVSAMLLALGISHEYRVAAYKKKGQFQHIYPVAFDTDGNAFIIDIVPEIPYFNYEASPIIDLKTVKMELHELSGVADAAVDVEAYAKEMLLEDLNSPYSLAGIEDDEDDELLASNFIAGFGEVDNEEEADLVLTGAGDVAELLERGLLAEVNKAVLMLQQEERRPTVLSQTINVKKELERLVNLMEVWGDEEERAEAIANAIASGSAYSNFYRALQDSLRNIANESLAGVDEEPVFLARMDVVEQASLQGLGRLRLKKFFKKIGSGVKKAVKAVVRFNPVTIPIRNAALLVLKLNLFNISGLLIYSYLTEAQARLRNLDLDEWRKLVNIRNNLEKYFTKLGGKPKNFMAAIVNGKARKRTGVQLGSLGEPVTAAASTAAASGFIAFAKKLLSKINPAKLFKKVVNKIKEKRANANASESGDALNFEDSTSMLPATTTSMEVDQFSNSSLPGPYQASVPQPYDGDRKGFVEKVKVFIRTHKKKLLMGVLPLVILLLSLIFWNKRKEQKKRSLAGVKAARTRARNRKKSALAGLGTVGTAGSVRKRRRRRKLDMPQLKGSTTVLKIPTKSVSKARISRTTNTSRLKRMHRKAKELQKKHPNTKYATLLKKAAKQI